MFLFSKKSIDSVKEKLSEKASSLADEALTYSSNVSESAKKLSSTVSEGTKSLTTSISGSLINAQNVVTGGVDDFWTRHKDLIEKIVIDGLIGIADDKLSDKEFMLSSFETLYELLPTPLRLVISRDFFINKCIAQKDVIQIKVIAVKKNRDKGVIQSDPTESDV